MVSVTIKARQMTLFTVIVLLKAYQKQKNFQKSDTITSLVKAVEKFGPLQNLANNIFNYSIKRYGHLSGIVAYLVKFTMISH